MNEQYRSPQTLSTLSIVGLGLMGLCHIISALVGIGQVASPDSALDLEDASLPIWVMLQGLVALAQFPVYIATVVLFLMWLYRAHSNLSVLLTSDLQFSSGWAVGWWFIPFANLIKPFQVVREVWCKSSPEVDTEPSFLSVSTCSAPTFMGFWWAFWIISNILSNITGNVFNPDDPSSLVASGYLFTISGILSATAAALAIKVVKDTTERQEARAVEVNRLRRNEPPPPPTF
jgi:hypothetical protein